MQPFSSPHTSSTRSGDVVDKSTFRLQLPRVRVIATIIRRDFAVTRSYRLAFVFDVGSGLVGLTVYYFISGLFGKFTPADLQGAPTYFAFAAVGAILSAVIYAASAGIADQLRVEQLTGTLEALVTHPISASQMCLGFTGFPFLFALFRAFVYLLVAGTWMDLDLEQVSWFGVCAVLICAGLALSAFGILSAAVVLVIKRGDALAGLAIYGITLLSGSVFPISALPGWLEAVGRIMPLRFAFDGVRAALFEGKGWAVDAAALAGFAAVTLPISMVFFSFALAHAKRAGSLAQY
jgi:ABC-2 type transport system permease protein